eukprot:TRINITY_DN8901_c0_g2_i2.p3 TRINITY_DN8901_c0_g2~~TRINITY_DN8901_c0_g2_i2.p3  ORF type:complete len:126 (-),score=19.24 TRINITY_DN8901_c0_g2_i2:997-1374(-)
MGKKSNLVKTYKMILRRMTNWKSFTQLLLLMTIFITAINADDQSCVFNTSLFTLKIPNFQQLKTPLYSMDGVRAGFSPGWRREFNFSNCRARERICLFVKHTIFPRKCIDGRDIQLTDFNLSYIK